MRLALTVVCMSGVSAFDPSRLMLRSLGIGIHRNKTFATPGTLAKDERSEGAGFANPATTAWTPIKLQLPVPTRAIR